MRCRRNIPNPSGLVSRCCGYEPSPVWAERWTHLTFERFVASGIPNPPRHAGGFRSVLWRIRKPNEKSPLSRKTVNTGTVIGRLREYDEERIPRGTNLFTFGKLPKHPPQRGMMSLDQRNCLRVSKRLFELGRADDIGEEQRQQSDAVSAPKVFDLCATGCCPISIHAASISSNPIVRKALTGDVRLDH